ncbi:unnamed protein product, partial [Darwinula stevensoni]
MINEYGPEFSGPDVDTLRRGRATRGRAKDAHKSNFLHPVFYFYDRYLPSDEEIANLGQNIWPYGLPRPSKLHHVAEDFLTIWLGSKMHILPLRRFLEVITGQDLRRHFNVRCFEVALNFSNVPQSCRNYLDGRGLQISVREGTDIANFLLGETSADKRKAECTEEDLDWVPSQVNRTKILESRLKRYYGNDDGDIFARDHKNDMEEMD